MSPAAETSLIDHTPLCDDDSQSWDVVFWLNLWRDNDAMTGDRLAE
jgi:hypothetical protein